VLLLAGPKIHDPDEVRVILRLGDQVEVARSIVIEQLSGLEQDLNDPVALTGLGGEPVEQCESHRYLP
jgi:hypothetical protein